MTPTLCPLLTFDPGTLLIGIAVGLALGIAGVLVGYHATGPSIPDDDPHARPFADSEGGPR